MIDDPVEAADTHTVVVRRNGDTTRPVSSIRQEDVLALLGSTTDRERRRVSPSDWIDARAAPWSIELVLDQAVDIETNGRGSVTLDGALLAFDHARFDRQILVRNGETYHSPFAQPDESLWSALRAALMSDAER